MLTALNNLCISCGKDTSFGTGRWFNRKPIKDKNRYICKICQNKQEK